MYTTLGIIRFQIIVPLCAMHMKFSSGKIEKVLNSRKSKNTGKCILTQIHLKSLGSHILISSQLFDTERKLGR